MHESELPTKSHTYTRTHSHTHVWAPTHVCTHTQQIYGGVTRRDVECLGILISCLVKEKEG